MDFNIIGVMAKDNSFVFNMKASYVPILNEEFDIDGAIFTIKYVRYKMTAGTIASQDVFLGLTKGSVK